MNGRKEIAMKVHDAMTPSVLLASPDWSIREAARAMADQDIGALPVGNDERLVGMITDRDIAVRAVAQGLGPDTPVRDVMSSEPVLYCHEDDDLEDVARNMGSVQVRRLPVVNRDKRLVGIIALSDLAHREDAKTMGHAVAGISTPGGAHSQAVH
jgi:CBS domain-containing protein